MHIFWFRRDLRLDDNHGLYLALTSSKNVLAIFIFDTTILSKLEKNDARVTFIHHQLASIQTQLQIVGKSLAIFYGDPTAVFQKLTTENPITHVHTNDDYEPSAIARDKRIIQLLASKKISFQSYKDQVIFEKDQILKNDNTPYVVYTPYANKWLESYRSESKTNFPSEKLISNLATHSYPFLSLNEIGFTESKIKTPPYSLSNTLLTQYEANRNFPDKNGTSFISTYLRFGCVSIRKIVHRAAEQENNTFLKELIWREFFMQILWHFPHTVTFSFKKKYDSIEWDNNELHFENWCNGQTGYPIVDAGMRELNQTGLMHNRVRMVVASFLCKHLLIDWRWGEAYFAQKLLDYEQSSNIGNWQWASGSGVDAAPYFRIFNPTEQTKKFDANLIYIKKWVPELETLNYATPIIDHKVARIRCLSRYKKGLENI